MKPSTKEGHETVSHKVGATCSNENASARVRSESGRSAWLRATDRRARREAEGSQDDDRGSKENEEVWKDVANEASRQDKTRGKERVHRKPFG